MANDNVMFIAGNLTQDPELRFTNTGDAVTNLVVANTPRYLKGDVWVDGEPIFMRVNVWRQLAENVANSFKQGDRVIVSGTLKQRNWEDKDGNSRVSIELEALEIGASVRFAEVTVEKNAKRESEPEPEPARKSTAKRATSRR